MSNWDQPKEAQNEEEGNKVSDCELRPARIKLHRLTVSTLLGLRLPKFLIWSTKLASILHNRYIMNFDEHAKPIKIEYCVQKQCNQTKGKIIQIFSHRRDQSDKCWGTTQQISICYKGCITNCKLLEYLGYSIFHLLIMIMRCIGSTLHHYAYASQKGLSYI